MIIICQFASDQLMIVVFNLIYFINQLIVQRIQKMAQAQQSHLENIVQDFQEDRLFRLNQYVQSRKRRHQKGITLVKQFENNDLSFEQKFKKLTQSDDLCYCNQRKEEQLKGSIYLDKNEALTLSNQQMAEKGDKKQVEHFIENQPNDKELYHASQQQQRQANKRLELYYQLSQAIEQNGIFTMRGLENLTFPPSFRSQSQFQSYDQDIFVSKSRSNGMKFKQIDQLPHTTHLDKNLEQSYQCQICLQEVKQGEQQTFLFCFHGFHSKCIKHWLVNSVSCPICKMNVQQYMKIAQKKSVR